MQKFQVDSKCIGCGSCFLETNLLVEDSAGKAVPAAKGSISEAFLPKAKGIVAACPVKALSIVTTTAVDLKTLPQLLEKKLKAVIIPEVKLQDIKMDAHKYSLSCPYPRGENQYVYSSESKAFRAAENEFDRICYSQYRRFILDIFVQYREDKLRYYYTFDENSFWHKLNSQYEKILIEIANEFEAVTEGKKKLPAGFTTFAEYPRGVANAEENDLYILKHFDEKSTCSGVMQDFNESEYHTRHSYIDMYADIDDMEVYTGESFWGDSKYEDRYCYSNVYKACEEYIKDLKDSINYVEVEDHPYDCLRNAIQNYKERVAVLIKQKVAELSKAVR